MKNIIAAISLSVICTLFFPQESIAQVDIQQQYKEFYDKSNTWEDFKVIKLYRMDEFWSIVTDTVNTKRETIRNANQQIASLKSELEAVNNELDETQASLIRSESLNDSIAFIGIQTSKTAYNIFVWVLILALGVGIGIVYMMFNRSNVITRKTRKDFEELEREFEAHRTRAREREIKVKRELQTALNQLQETRV